MNSRPRADLLSTWLGLAVLGSLTGCADDELPLPPVVWEGQAVRVRMDDPAIEVCGGSFEALDRHAVLVRQALLLEGEDVIEYSIGDETFVQPLCTNSDACTYPESGYVYTTLPFVPHEIVHSVRRLDPYIGLLRSAFEEGLATLYGTDTLGNGMVDLDVLDLLDEALVSGRAGYYRAGHTMAILLERHGPEAFREFDTLARTEAEDSAFARAFGETMEGFAAAAEASVHCEQSQWWIPLLECDGEPVEADPQTGVLTITGDLNCSESDVVGPREGKIWISRYFHLEDATTNISYDIEMPEDAQLEIVSCNSGCPERLAYIGGIWDVGSINRGIPGLEPGDYFLRMSRANTDTDGHFSFVIN